MGLYVQQGYGKGTRLQPLIDGGVAEGWILSPYDESPAALQATADQLQGSPLRVLLDPQTWIHSIDGSSTHKLADFDLEIAGFGLGMSAAAVQAHVDSVVQLANGLGVDTLLAPTVIQAGFQDAWSGLSVQFARSTAQSFAGSTFASVVFEEHSLSDWNAVSQWLNAITAIDEVNGVYVCPVRSVAGPYPYAWSDPQRLANLLSVVYRLTRNGLEVVCGYQDIEGLAMLAAGARALGSGWSVNRRILIRDRWVPQGGGAAPLVRIWLSAALAPIRREDAVTANLDGIVRSAVSATDRARMQAADNTDNSTSQLNYLNDLGETARVIQEDPSAIDALLEQALTALGTLRARIPPIEPVHATRITSTRRALQLFRGREGL
jgi:hypothetical protein